MRVMICDDSQFSSNLLEEIILTEGDIDIEKTFSKKDIIPNLFKLEEKNQLVDIVFLNKTMNNKSTLSLIKNIKDNFPRTRIALCGSVDLTDEALNEALKKGAKYFITKPYKLNEVANILKRSED